MVQLETTDGIAWVTLNRPEKQNALSYEMFRQLDNIIHTLRRDRQLRAVVLQGQGAHFCAGLDVSAVMKKPRNIVSLLGKWLPGKANLVQRVSLGWRALPVPVFALVRGNCLGGGLHIALGADYRIVSPDAQFAIMEARWGLCPDMSTSIMLPGIMRHDQALWLASNPQRITAEQAYEMGLVTEICDDPLVSIQQRIAQLESVSPDALAAIKCLYNSAYYPSQRKLLWQETWFQIKLLLSKNTRTAMYNGRQSDTPKPYRPRGKW
ncbi:crotonase/enoyl-CoA hydratase family protein [Pseudoalteromonas sp. OOF1S-7]|uniref:crotonase/enoyl-CoA hydratase family protein n=1 Tax=Pseudoalteromonas sp. OOF1S-7 TaxID=2917757 RepID=UPI001EF6E58F|nr:crotonase/enoyl-CoA hydratase family protein [Pseudoalteromonas sp. OOF1S-7]MCG7533739.1 crotonase/enoyl-CoA hydratase family protein [Pseudoalteromonas sp. OOF1S-7]